jgi:hypothetical protein
MSFYLLQEDGSKLLLEDGTGAILLESVPVPGPTIFYQGGGGGEEPRRSRRTRRETDRLFAAIERSLEAALGLGPEPLAHPVSPAETVREPLPGWSPVALESTLARLAEVARGHEGLETRLERLREGLAAIEARRRAEQDDEDTWLLMA